MKNIFKMKHAFASVAFTLASSAALAGPVILGGDDLTDHGSRSGGVNLEGWKYIELAVSNITSSQTRAGLLTHDIVALGSAANPGFTASNAGGAIGSAANVLGKTVLYVDGAAAINQFFLDLASGAVNPGMMWFAGSDATNDLDATEGAALTTNAAAINLFGASGGGIMAHGSGSSAYGWLGALLPGLTEGGNCNSTGATLTAAGQAAFPGLTNANINNAAGPCHSSFTGSFGGLTTLAFDGGGRSYIIGGGANTVIQCGDPGQDPCPPPPNNVPVPASLPLIALDLLGLLGLRRHIAR